MRSHTKKGKKQYLFAFFRPTHRHKRHKNMINDKSWLCFARMATKSIKLDSVFFSLSDAENIPIKKIVAVAGRNLTLSCPGVNEQSLINTLTWKTSQTIAKFVNGVPLKRDQRVSFNFPFSAMIVRILDNFFLKPLFHKS